MNNKDIFKNQALDLSIIVTEERLRASGITIDHKSFGLNKPVVNQKLKNLMGKKLIKWLAGTDK